MNKIKKLLIYAGVDKENYEAVRPSIIQQNRLTVQRASITAMLIALCAYICSFVVNELSVDRCLYEIYVVMSAMFLTLAVWLTEKHSTLIIPLMYLSYSAYYAYATIIATLLGRDSKVFMVMLVFLPILFIGKPIRFIVLTAIHIGIFIGLCFKTKTGYVLCSDILDSIMFGALGMIAGTASTAFKVRSYVQTQKLTGLSRFDSLTGMKNRNAYEEDLGKITANCKKALGCVYVDVNGLKYVNDNKGHEEGDRMLKTVAGEIMKYFDYEYIYRIGGDEFVIFVPDPTWGEIKTKTDKILEEIQPRSYYAAIGWKVHNLDNLSIHSLIREAEAYMYDKKDEFYSRSEFDRRKPRKPILHTQSLEEALESQDS